MDVWIERRTFGWMDGSRMTGAALAGGWQVGGWGIMKLLQYKGVIAIR